MIFFTEKKSVVVELYLSEGKQAGKYIGGWATRRAGRWVGKKAGGRTGGWAGRQAGRQLVFGCSEDTFIRLACTNMSR